MTAAWEHRATHKVLGLAGGRMVAQLLGLAWFLVAARSFDADDFGVLSAGLILVSVIGGISDLGATRTIVRHVAADPTSLRNNFLVTAGVRGAGAAVVGVAAVVIAPMLQDELSPSIVVAATAIAVVSGVTEVGFCGLRSVGRVGTEVTLLVAERVLFVATGTAAVLLGYGPLAVLWAYAITNSISAAIVGVRCWFWADGRVGHAGPMFDAEGRRTALGSTLVVVGPRISGFLLVLMSTSVVVGSFTVAQKVPEALGTLGIAILMPLLPMTRSAVIRGRERPAVRRASLLAAAVAAALTPLAVLLSIQGHQIIDMLFGLGDRPGVTTATMLLSWAMVIWVVRSFGELILLAQERASRFVAAIAASVIANIALGVFWIPDHGATGAAGATLVAESLVFLLVFAGLRQTLRPEDARAFIPSLIVGAITAVTCLAFRSAPLAVPASLATIWSLCGLTFTGLKLRTQSRSTDSGQDDDEFQDGTSPQVLGSQSVDAIELFSAPTDSL